MEQVTLTRHIFQPLLRVCSFIEQFKHVKIKSRMRNKNLHFCNILYAWQNLLKSYKKNLD